MPSSPLFWVKSGKSLANLFSQPPRLLFPNMTCHKLVFVHFNENFANSLVPLLCLILCVSSRIYNSFQLCLSDYAKVKYISAKKQWTRDAFMTSSVFHNSRHGFLVLQSPVSSLWMRPRPPFQPQSYSFGIIVPKEILGNTDLKTAITSTVFVAVHSSTDSSHKYYLVATTKQ